MEHLVFLTGRLAQPSLERVLGGIDALPFTWEVREIGLQVAALMTADLIRRRVPTPVVTPANGDEAPRRADRIIVPGRCRGDIDALSQHYGVPVQRGPEELKDLPRFFNREARPIDLSEYEVAIFAEIVDAHRLPVDAIVERARAYSADGANVIDLGSLPGVAFDHLEDSVRALKSEGFSVSVDSLDTDELLRGGRAGADYLLSLTLDTLWVADEVASTPVLIGRMPTDEASLHEAIERMQASGKAFLADAILDPLPFGMTAAIVRYHRLRERFPEAAIMMGVGNVTELTEADTSGINALLPIDKQCAEHGAQDDDHRCQLREHRANAPHSRILRVDRSRLACKCVLEFAPRLQSTAITKVVECRDLSPPRAIAVDALGNAIERVALNDLHGAKLRGLALDDNSWRRDDSLRQRLRKW
jgi:hypothetical protein